MELNAQPGQKALIILNPVSGMGNPDQLQRVCSREFEKAGWQVDFHHTLAGEDLSAFVSSAVKNSYSLVVASGGDGTVAEVAGGLANSPVPLGILPSGTWNAIARNLIIPLNVNRAINLILGEHAISSLDLMAVGDHIHAMNLTVGFSVAMIQSTGRQEKRKWGVFAYVGNILAQLFGLKLKRYILEIDGVTYKIRASEIVVANYGIVGIRSLENLLEIHPDDGKADVIVVRATTILDVPTLFWRVLIKREKRTPVVRIFSAAENIVISAKTPVVVQADGEIIGMTPVEIKVLPRCVQVITPLPRKNLLPEIDFRNPLAHPPGR